MKFRYVFRVNVSKLGSRLPPQRYYHEIDAVNFWEARGSVFTVFRPAAADDEMIEAELVALAACSE